MRGPLAAKLLRAPGRPWPRAQDLFDAALEKTAGGVIGHLPVPLHEIEAARFPNPRPGPPGPERAFRPKVSVVIPFRDRPDLLKTCLSSLLAVTRYPDWNGVLVDNGSRDPETLAYLRNLPDRRFEVIRHDAPFNFSELVNRGVAAADGEIVVLLNNDVTAVRPDWLEILARYAVRPEVGCAGAKLLYPNGLVQHGGILCGLGAAWDGPAPPGLAHAGWPGDSEGYFGLLNSPRMVSAVSGAALAVRRELYHHLGGFDPELAVAFNDVDFGLKAGQAGLACVLAAESVLIHHESASRRMDRTSGQKMKRLKNEWAVLRRRWGARLEADPWYSPNLCPDSGYEARTPPARRRARLMPLSRGNRLC